MRFRRASILSMVSRVMLFDPDPPAPPAPGTDPPAPPADDPTKVTVTKTQAELTAMFAAEHAKGKRAGKSEFEQQVATELGVSIADAKKVIADHNAAQEAAKTEAQRLQDAAQAREQAAADREAAANARAHNLRVKEALLDAGVNRSKADRLRAQVTVAPDADDDALKAAVEELRTDFPEQFTGEGGGPGPVDGNGKGKPPAKNAPTGGFTRGQERAAKRNPQPVNAG